MIFIISTLKIIFLLGFLIFIHETGHFTVAKLCGVKVNEFSIGFGPKIIKKIHKGTKYNLRLIPLGGFVSMEGEDEESSDEHSFTKASVLKRILIVVAGATVNIIFGLFLFMTIISINKNSLNIGVSETVEFFKRSIDAVFLLLTGHVNINDLSGPVGISQVVSETSGFMQYFYILSIVSVSLGITNLLPIPALDGGKIVLLIIEAIRKKPLKQELELKIQLLGFSFLIVLSIFVTYNDIIRVIK